MSRLTNLPASLRAAGDARFGLDRFGHLAANHSTEE